MAPPKGNHQRRNCGFRQRQRSRVVGDISHWLLIFGDRATGRTHGAHVHRDRSCAPSGAARCNSLASINAPAARDVTHEHDRGGPPRNARGSLTMLGKRSSVYPKRCVEKFGCSTIHTRSARAGFGPWRLGPGSECLQLTASVSASAPISLVGGVGTAWQAVALHRIEFQAPHPLLPAVWSTEGSNCTMRSSAANAPGNVCQLGSAQKLQSARALKTPP